MISVSIQLIVFMIINVRADRRLVAEFIDHIEE